MAIAKVTGSMCEVVCVMIKGEGNEKTSVLNDNGVVGELLKFLIEQKICSVIRAGHSGAGQYQGFFNHEDAHKIRIWLERKGVEIER